MTSLMMSSCCTFRLNRRSAFSSGSPSCTRTSAKEIHLQTCQGAFPIILERLSRRSSTKRFPPKYSSGRGESRRKRLRISAGPDLEQISDPDGLVQRSPDRPAHRAVDLTRRPREIRARYPKGARAPSLRLLSVARVGNLNGSGRQETRKP